MAGNVLIKVGDVFDRTTDLLVLPCTTTGVITPTISEGVWRLELPKPPVNLDVGQVEFFHLPRSNEISRVVAYAASVRRRESPAHSGPISRAQAYPMAIERIASQVGRYSDMRKSIRQISAPLLGSGAGRLKPVEAFEAMLTGFLANGAELTTLTIYCEDEQTLEATGAEGFMRG